MRRLVLFAGIALFAQQQRPVEGTLREGDPAPDFKLKKLRSDETIQLSSFAGVRPVALVFGSYT
jgi:hypothetical protein